MDQKRVLCKKSYNARCESMFQSTGTRIIWTIMQEIILSPIVWTLFYCNYIISLSIIDYVSIDFSHMCISYDLEAKFGKYSREVIEDWIHWIPAWMIARRLRGIEALGIMTSLKGSAVQGAWHAIIIWLSNNYLSHNIFQKRKKLRCLLWIEPKFCWA